MSSQASNYYQELREYQSIFSKILSESPVHDPLGDGISSLQLIGIMGGDLDVVNDARASYNRHSTSWSEKDSRLIDYLARNNHTSPFRGCVLKFRISAPLFVARQWYKHVIGSTHIDEQNGWNEQSFRYTTPEPIFYIPQQFKKQSGSNKQVADLPLDDETNSRLIELFDKQFQLAYSAYQSCLACGVGKEQARMLLPNSVYTTWIWTVSLQALLHFLDLRSSNSAQSEIMEFAKCLSTILEYFFPESQKAWKTNEDKNI